MINALQATKATQKQIDENTRSMVQAEVECTRRLKQIRARAIAIWLPGYLAKCEKEIKEQIRRGESRATVDWEDFYDKDKHDVHWELISHKLRKAGYKVIYHETEQEIDAPVLRYLIIQWPKPTKT